MKKNLSLFFALVATTSLWAYDFKVGGIYYNILADKNNEVEVTHNGNYMETGYNSYSGSVTIPVSVVYSGTTYSVTSIGYSAFNACYSLTSVTIPNTVTEILGYAFDDCSSLTSVIIPNSVTTIDYYAFNGCSSLTSVTIPNGVTSIGEGAFYDCSSLTSVIIPNGVTSIGEGAFYDCSSLTSVIIPNSVTEIGDWAFFGTGIYNNTSNWENSVLYIGDCLITVEQSISGTCTIKDGTRLIANRAFAGCSSLNFIAIPNSVTEIGDYVFEGCSGLNTPVYNTHCFAYMPANYTGAYIVPDGIKQIVAGAFNGCSSLTSITIPNSITSIGDLAFAWTGLTSVTIPNTVAELGGGLFMGCEKLTSAALPNSVTEIGDRTFDGCSSLTSITIPNSVTKIGSSAFYGCSSLTSITIPNGVTEIGYDAFRHCKSLTYLSIPSSVVYKFGYLNPYTGEIEYYYSDGYQAIVGCDNLKTLIVPADFFAYYGRQDDEDAYQNVKIYYLSLLPKSLESLTINTGELPRLAWDFIERNRTALKQIDLAVTTGTTLPVEVFRNYYNLTSLQLPSQLQSIPYMAIAECKMLQSITIPATVTEIDNSAFENCRSLKSVIFEGAAVPKGAASYAAASGSSLWRIGSWAFYNCHQLQQLTIPEGVTELGDAAFYGCTYLEEMSLPSTIQSIGDNGFALCDKLEIMYVKAPVPPTIQAKTFYNVKRKIPVYVPLGAVDLYKNDTYWSEFKIMSEEDAVENVTDPNAYSVRKMLRDGQVVILRDGVVYNAVGIRL